MKIVLKTGEILQAEDKYIDLSQKLILVYVIDKEGKKKKVFINPEEISLIELEDTEKEQE